MTAVSGRFGVAVLLLVLVTGCSSTLAGNGTVATDVLVPGTTGPAPTTTPTPSPTPAPSPTQRTLDPAAVARAVDIRATDLPHGWREIPGSRTGGDTRDWLVECARDAGVAPGTLSGSETPDWSATGTDASSEVGTTTGLFPTPAAAARWVALFRQRPFGACVAAEALRSTPGVYRSVPAATPGPVRVPTAEDAAGMSTTATVRDGRRNTFQFFAIRTGPIVTMINTSWRVAPDDSVVATAAARIGARQRTV